MLMLVVAEHGMITVTRCGYVLVIVTTQQRIMKEDDHRDQQKNVGSARFPSTWSHAMMVHDIQGDDTARQWQRVPTVHHG